MTTSLFEICLKDSRFSIGTNERMYVFLGAMGEAETNENNGNT